MGAVSDNSLHLSLSVACCLYIINLLSTTCDTVEVCWRIDCEQMMTKYTDRKIEILLVM